jgi:hypothetical protein
LIWSLETEHFVLRLISCGWSFFFLYGHASGWLFVSLLGIIVGFVYMYPCDVSDA